MTHPRSKSDTLRIEGEATPVTLQLLMPKASIPFLTYTPPDLGYQLRSLNSCEGHYFFANFGGKPNEQAYLLMCILPATMMQEQAVAETKKLKAELDNKAFFTDVTLKAHGARFYIIVRHYPQEYGDGMGPRIQKILDEWQWLDAS